jgi:predicted  nucleic acid-binding Zn-ribbon protein
LKALDREFKTVTRSLDQLKEKVNGFEQQRGKLDRDADEVQQKCGDVSHMARKLRPTYRFLQLEKKVGSLGEDLKNTRRELDKQHSERVRIQYVSRS